MAASRSINDPDFGTREEDWPEVDIDLSTEEGAEALRRSEAAWQAGDRRAEERREQKRQQHREELRRQYAHLGIPDALYVKAKEHQDQLTEEERNLLISRSDLIGKALGRPDSLTPDEIHQLLFWPSPDVVHANIRLATGGTLSTPTELYAKAKDAIDCGQFDTMLNQKEIKLLARHFFAEENSDRLRNSLIASATPGFREASDLLRSRLGIHGVVYSEAGFYEITHRRGDFAEDRRTPPRHSPPPADPPLHTDLYGLGPWPQASVPMDPIHLFMVTTKISGWGVERKWSALPEEQKEDYRTKCEALRLEAWAKIQRPGMPPQPTPISGASLYRDEVLGAETGWDEVLQKYARLDSEVMREYRRRAGAQRMAAWDTYREACRQVLERG